MRANYTHYQTGRGTLCSLDNDASNRTPTEDESAVTCPYCLELIRLNSIRLESVPITRPTISQK